MTYKEIMMANFAKFKGNDTLMWDMIGDISDFVEEIKEPMPEAYWKLMRKTHIRTVGRHFDKQYAVWQVDGLSHKGDDGKVYEGEHWSIEDTNGVLAKYRSRIPSAYNEWDVYVALNAHYHDYCAWARRKFPNDYESVIIEMAIAFWFNDDDWGSTTKVWDYFDAKNQMAK